MHVVVAQARPPSLGPCAACRGPWAAPRPCCCTSWRPSACNSRTNPCSMLAWDLANARALLGEVNEMGGTMQIHVGRPTDILDQLHARFSITKPAQPRRNGSSVVVGPGQAGRFVVRRQRRVVERTSLERRRASLDRPRPMEQHPKPKDGSTAHPSTGGPPRASNAHLHRPQRGVVPVLQRTGSNAPPNPERNMHVRGLIPFFRLDLMPTCPPSPTPPPPRKARQGCLPTSPAACSASGR